MAAEEMDVISGQDRKRSVRRTALWLGVLAATFYFGFIAMSVWRSLS